jgi:hypothetical protein
VLLLEGQRIKDKGERFGVKRSRRKTKGRKLKLLGQKDNGDRFEGEKRQLPAFAEYPVRKDGDECEKGIR